MTPVTGAVSVKRLVIRSEVMGCFRCDNCQALNIGIAIGLPGNQSPLDWLAATKVKAWMPKPSPDISFPDVPAEIAATAVEAYRCWLMADANRAAVLLARSVIEAAAKDKGITQGSLFEKIDRMHEQHLIRADVRDGAHEVRHLGNDMAHGDLGSPVTAAETDLLLNLMREVLVDVYQTPAKVTQAQANRRQREEIGAWVTGFDASGPGLSPWMTQEAQQALPLLLGPSTPAAQVTLCNDQSTPQGESDSPSSS